MYVLKVCYIDTYQHILTQTSHACWKLKRRKTQKRDGRRPLKDRDADGMLDPAKRSVDTAPVLVPTRGSVRVNHPNSTMNGVKLSIKGNQVPSAPHPAAVEKVG